MLTTLDDIQESVRERVLLELAQKDKSDTKAIFAAITEAAATVLDVERASIWQLQGGPPLASVRESKLVCKDLYLSSQRQHSLFEPIHGSEFPTYLEAIQQRRTITADDAQTDPRTFEFRDFYLRPLGITSMMDVPIWHGGKVYGVLCLEHIGESRRWRWDEQDFAINMTDIAASALEAAERVAMGRRWVSVIESVSEAVIVMAPDGKVIQCNAAAHRLFNDENRQLVNRSDLIDHIELVDAVDRPLPADEFPFPRARRGEYIRGEIYGVVFKRTGERRYIRTTCSPVCENDAVAAYVLVADDATEDVFVERLKRELLSGLAHELKTPLAIAKGYAQQLASAHELPHRECRMLDAIVHAVDRMDHLSETMLDLASVMLGRLRLTRERVDFVELVRSLVRRAEQSEPGERARQFEMTTVEEPVPVIVDCTRIAQAIRHLLENAITYSPAESRIDIEVATTPENVELSVRDHGIGIPPPMQSQLFSPFFKGSAGGGHGRGGLGIGLYLAREIVRRHGGEVRCESAEGSGSTFHLTLPRAGVM